MFHSPVHLTRTISGTLEYPCVRIMGGCVQQPVHRMSAKHIRNAFILLLACLFLTGIVSAAGIQAVSGDIIPLSGYSPTSIQVYLFLTGPNLPVNGVALNDITQRADEGHFTKVQVMGDDSWSYKWNTGNLNGRLDDGTYTVWVVNGPNDRSNLQNAEYGTISVTLGSPTLSAGTSGGVSAASSSPSCSLVITSDPAECSVVVNGEYKGKTPLTVGNLYAGTYTINVTKFGYMPYSTTVRLADGAEATITAFLPPERGTLDVNTTPSGAQVSLDGAVAGISPVTLINVLPGDHNLTISKDGYVPVQQQVTIAAGITSVANVALSPVSPLSALPIKTPGMTVATIAGLCAAAGAVMVFRSRKD